jgi:hypothetical protein
MTAFGQRTPVPVTDHGLLDGFGGGLGSRHRAEADIPFEIGDSVADDDLDLPLGEGHTRDADGLHRALWTALERRGLHGQID